MKEVKLKDLMMENLELVFDDKTIIVERQSVYNQIVLLINRDGIEKITIEEIIEIWKKSTTSNRSIIDKIPLPRIEEWTNEILVEGSEKLKVNKISNTELFNQELEEQQRLINEIYSNLAIQQKLLNYINKVEK